MYKEGRGVPRDDTKAVDWCLKAAECGHIEARFHLSRFFCMSDRGVSIDESKASE